jgi:hypothetical protein
VDKKTDAAMADMACNSYQFSNNPASSFVICGSSSIMLIFSKEKIQ